MRDDYEEVKVLSTVLRDLIRRLAEKTRQMNQLNTTLEERVTERTRELEKANKKLEETVRTDAVTGLNNRRYLFELGKTSIKKAVRAGTPLSAIMFDADYFKKVNDTYGHAVGDKALIHLSSLANGAVRDIDILARIGGEEFAVLLENTTEEKAAEVAERLRTAIADSPLPLERGNLSLNVSVGVASFIPDSSDELDILLVQADKALYAAKAGGRNRVYLYSQIRQQTDNH
jgi:diguanylate cyclase